MKNFTHLIEGGRYRMRNGDVTGVKLNPGYSSDSAFIATGDRVVTWTKEGFWIANMEHQNDLIEHLAPTTPADLRTKLLEIAKLLNEHNEINHTETMASVRAEMKEAGFILDGIGEENEQRN